MAQIAESLEARIDEKIPLAEAQRRTRVKDPCPLEEIPPCSMSRPELNFFYALAVKFGGPILELGAYAGGSARAFWFGLLDRADEPLVYSVDLYHRWRPGPDEFPGLVQIVSNGRTYCHDGSRPRIGFEDADHTRLCTYDGLCRLKDAGCEILLVHDICPQKLRDAPMPMSETSRAGALSFFAENPEFRLIEVERGQGIFIGLPRDVEF